MAKCFQIIKKKKKKKIVKKHADFEYNRFANNTCSWRKIYEMIEEYVYC